MKRNADKAVRTAAALTALALLFGSGGCGKETPPPAGASSSPPAQFGNREPPDYAAHGIRPHPARFWEKSE